MDVHSIFSVTEDDLMHGDALKATRRDDLPRYESKPHTLYNCRCAYLWIQATYRYLHLINHFTFIYIYSVQVQCMCFVHPVLVGCSNGGWSVYLCVRCKTQPVQIKWPIAYQYRSTRFN